MQIDKLSTENTLPNDKLLYDWLIDLSDVKKSVSQLQNPFYLKKSFLEVLKKYRYNNSIDFVQKYIDLFDNIEEFKNFCTKESSFIKLLKKWDIEFLLWRKWIIKNKNDLYSLVNSNKWNDILYVLEYNPNISEILFKFMFNNYSFNWLSEEEINKIKNNLFTVKSSTSKINNELFESLEKHKTDSKKWMYNIMNNNINQYLDNKKILDNKKYTSEEIQNNQKKIIEYFNSNTTGEEKEILKKLWIDLSQIRLNLYLRYRNEVNFPEIWEYIALFIDKSISKWYFKYLSWTTIIPRYKNAFPRFWFFEWNNIIKFIPDSSKIFELVSKKYWIRLHLSHSIYEDTEDLPYVSSLWMNKSWKNNLNTSIELEDGKEYYNMDYKTKIFNRFFQKKDRIKKIGERSLYSIFDEIFEILQKIDKKLDEKFKN